MMDPEVRVDKGFVTRSIAVLLLCLAAGSGLVLWAGQEGQPSPTWGVVLIVSIIMAWASIGWVIVRPCFFTYHCPVCGQSLPRMQTAIAGGSVRYHCERCHIVWDLLIRWGDGSM